MPEKLYAILLKLYPEHFRRTYGDEALRLVRDRARDEKGFLPGLSLWLDLLLDLAISLPREYRRSPTMPLRAAQPANGNLSFQLLDEPSVDPALLLAGGTIAALLFWACVTSVAHTPAFPDLFRDSHSLQGLVQTDLALARMPTDADATPGKAKISAYNFCMAAGHDITNNPAQPLITFTFAPPGASGVALIDGKIVGMFRNEQHVAIHSDVVAGPHHFELNLEKPVENTAISDSEDFAYCAGT